MKEKTQQSSSLERYVQAIISSTAVAVMMWVGSTLNSQINSIARLEERNASLSAQVEQLSKAIHEQRNTFYTRLEAKRDKSEFTDQLKQIKMRIEKLKKQEG